MLCVVECAFMRYVVCVLLLMIGFWLRVALHDAHGLEGDDGVTIHLLPIETGALIEGLRKQELDVHPPLYFVTLQTWTRLAGDSLLSLRLLNILADMLTGALLLRLVGRVSHLKVAWTAGLLWLCAPLVLFTLFPIRMYPLLGLWVMGGAVCVTEIIYKSPISIQNLTPQPPLHFVERGGKKLFLFRWTLFFLCTLAALYTHIFGVLAVVTYALTFFVAGLRRMVGWRTVMIAWGSIGVAGIVFLPFGLPMLERFASGGALGAQASVSPANVWEIPGQLILVMLSHRIVTDSGLGTAIFVMLIIASGNAVWRGLLRPTAAKSHHVHFQNHRFAAPPSVMIFILTWGMIGGAMVLAMVADIYRPRYVAPFVPLLLATISLLLWQIRWHVMRTAILIGLVVISGAGSLHNLGSSAYDDWRAAAQFLEKMARPGDKIVIIPAWGAKAFGYHYQGDVPIAAILPGVTADVDLDPILSDATSGYDRVWFVRYQVDISDPANRADNWFRERAITMTEVYPTGVQIKGYDFTPTVSTLPADVRKLDANFENIIQLRGIDMPITQGSGRDTRLHPPSNWIHLTLYWEKLQAHPDLALRIRLTDVIGNTWAAPLERDNDLLRRQPLATWTLNTLYAFSLDLNMNPVIPPGDYYIEVMVLDAVTGTPLRTTGSDAGEFWAIAGQFTVTAGG